MSFMKGVLRDICRNLCQRVENLWYILFLSVLLVFLLNGSAVAQTVPLPKITFGITPAKSPQDVAVTLQILFFLTILSLAPAILIMVTSFTRIVIVLSFVRSALGTQQMPPNQVLIGLALFLTFFTMAPTWVAVNKSALQPYLNNKISATQAWNKGLKPVRAFMFKQVREKDLALFMRMANLKQPRNKKDVPTYVLIPAFILSELKTAFEMGVLIYIPFIIIDMIVASVLMSMGMIMLPPMLISLPFKILLFVMVDGWDLVVKSVIVSFH